MKKKRAARFLATKRGYTPDPPQEPTAKYTGKIANKGNGERFRVIKYKHGRNYGMTIHTNHDRVTAMRILAEL